MTRKTIPQSIEITCDCCERVCSEGLNARRIQGGKLIIRQHALDAYGSPAGDGSVELDLCDSCLHKLGSFINERIQHIRDCILAS